MFVNTTMFLRLKVKILPLRITVFIESATAWVRSGLSNYGNQGWDRGASQRALCFSSTSSCLLRHGQWSV